MLVSSLYTRHLLTPTLLHYTNMGTCNSSELNNIFHGQFRVTTFGHMIYFAWTIWTYKVRLNPLKPEVSSMSGSWRHHISWTELRHSGLAEPAALAPTLAAIFVGQTNAIFSGRHTFQTGEIWRRPSTHKTWLPIKTKTFQMKFKSLRVGK